MKKELSIRRLYRPVQPAVKLTDRHVSYREIFPDTKLHNIIYCYWELKTSEPLQNPFTYRVVADGCIDIIFQPDNPSENYAMGFCKRYNEFPLSNQFHYAGIRFFPAMFPTLFRIDAKELSNRYEKLDLIDKKISAFLTNRFSDNDDLPSIKTKLDTYFCYLIHKTDVVPDERFRNACHIILKNSGAVHIQKDLDTGLSPRQLRRYFEFYIGDTAKTFSQVVRFQNILNAKPSDQSFRQNKVFFDMGYYDQAHFIKEFKNFYGVTPGKAFER